MPMRLSGLMSGMDTESIIQDLVSVRRKKVDDVKKAQKKLAVKQDAWKSLNAKLKNLQSKYFGAMRFADAYSKKTTKVSNSSIVSVITGDKAVNGVQNLQVKQLAKTGYLTGGKISGVEGSQLTALSKLSEIFTQNADGSYSQAFGDGGSGVINITAGGKSVDIEMNGDTTISDVLTKLKDAGLNASFDAKQQRFFVSAKESGLANDFSITASDANGAKALSALGLQVDLASDKATMAKYEEYNKYYVAGDTDEARAATLANMSKLIGTATQSSVDGYLKQYESLKASQKAAQEKIDKIKEKYTDTELTFTEADEEALTAKHTAIEEQQKKLDELVAAGAAPEEVRAAEEELKTLKEEANEMTLRKADVEMVAAQEKTVADLQTKLDDVSKYVNVSETTDAEGKVTYSAEATDTLKKEVEDSYYNKAAYAHEVVNNPGMLGVSGATKVNAQDAIIVLNGAEFTDSTNVFEINGLTFTALSETKEGENVTITTQDDTEGIYDMIRGFLKEYNAVINEMDKLYNADAEKGYEPLTDEEKESMSDKEIEEWENKIKDSILRRDSNLSTVSSALKEIMAGGIQVGGKRMYLSDFGINTRGYFEAPDNEKNAYHLDGDKDDEVTGANADKLLGMISNDPDTVISFFSQLSKDMYSKMFDLSKSVEGYRSFGNFYDDKKLKEDHDNYNSKIADLEKKLNAYEDMWYKKFSSMETAMAKMQQSVSAVTSLLGGS